MVAFHHAERAPRVTRSLTAESPTIRGPKNILGVDIGILATRVLRAGKVRKSAGAKCWLVASAEMYLHVEMWIWMFL